MLTTKPNVYVCTCAPAVWIYIRKLVRLFCSSREPADDGTSPGGKPVADVRFSFGKNGVPDTPLRGCAARNRDLLLGVFQRSANGLGNATTRESRGCSRIPYNNAYVHTLFRDFGNIVRESSLSVVFAQRARARHILLSFLRACPVRQLRPPSAVIWPKVYAATGKLHAGDESYTSGADGVGDLTSRANDRPRRVSWSKGPSPGARYSRRNRTLSDISDFRNGRPPTYINVGIDSREPSPINGCPYTFVGRWKWTVNRRNSPTRPPDTKCFDGRPTGFPRVYTSRPYRNPSSSSPVLLLFVRYFRRRGPNKNRRTIYIRPMAGAFSIRFAPTTGRPR